jgi:DNA polymerase-3 subunit epsilon
MQNQVAAVTYEATGSELVALLKESAEIKRNKPSFNKAMRRNIFTHALYSFTDENGYLNLKIDSADGRKMPITTFSNYQSGKQFLFKAVDNFKLCPKLVGLDTAKKSCFKYQVKECEGACIEEESALDYNIRVQEMIAKNSYDNQDMVIIDKGRAIDEHSVLLIEDGIFKGLGFYNLNYQITNKKVLETIITPMDNNRDTQHIIQSYLRKNKQVKRIELIK